MSKSDKEKEKEVEKSFLPQTNMDKSEIEKDRRRYNLGICLFVWLDVLLFSLIVITAYYMCSENNITVTRDADICVPCKELKIHPDDKVEGVEKRGETCCMKENENSDVLVGYFIDHWLKEKLAKDDRQFTRYECKDERGTAPKPTIKLVGKTELQTVGHHKVVWDGKSDAAIVPDDKIITHHEHHGFIEIKKAGLYQVYTQIVLEHYTNLPNPHNVPPIYEHCVIRIEAGTSDREPNREKIILKTSNSHCSSKSDRQTITSYLGGAFQLAEGDRLAVKVHNKTEVVPVAHMNFFGAHML